MSVGPEKNWGLNGLFSLKCLVLTSLTDFHPCSVSLWALHSALLRDREIKLQPRLNAHDGRIWWFFETCQGRFLLEVCSEHWPFLCVLLFPLPFFFAFLPHYPLLVSEKGQKGDWCIWAGLATSKAVSSIDTRISFGREQPLGRQAFVGSLLFSPRWCWCTAGSHLAMSRP